MHFYNLQNKIDRKIAFIECVHFIMQAIGACGGTEKLEIVSKFGAKFTIDYKKENLRERIKEITKGKGIDIVFDSVGGEMFEDSLKW